MWDAFIDGIPKGAVHALAGALRVEAADHGVEVSLLIPAATQTKIITDAERNRPAHYAP
jgi:short-subunit dehydrogenase